MHVYSGRWLNAETFAEFYGKILIVSYCCTAVAMKCFDHEGRIGDAKMANSNDIGCKPTPRSLKLLNIHTVTVDDTRGAEDPCPRRTELEIPVNLVDKDDPDMRLFQIRNILVKIVSFAWVRAERIYLLFLYHYGFSLLMALMVLSVGAVYSSPSSCHWSLPTDMMVVGATNVFCGAITFSVRSSRAKEGILIYNASQSLFNILIFPVGVLALAFIRIPVHNKSNQDTGKHYCDEAPWYVAVAYFVYFSMTMLLIVLLAFSAVVLLARDSIKTRTKREKNCRTLSIVPGDIAEVHV